MTDAPILITGGAGFIGSHLADRLLAAGCHVRVLDNLSTGLRENLPEEAGRLRRDETQAPRGDRRGDREGRPEVHRAAEAVLERLTSKKKLGS